jgi:CheY-like chemotaxis protein
MLLRTRGHDVRTAFDGAAALASIPAFTPEVVLLDLGLPDVDGYEVARRVRALPTAEPLLLVALTGWGQEEDRRRSAEAGFDAHLTKPLEIDALHQLLDGGPNRPKAEVARW